MIHQKQHIFLCLGSNEGDRLAMLKQACELIEKEVGPIQKRSSIYETEPWGMEGADPFLNQVLEVTSMLMSLELLSVLLGIERKLGRIRDTGSTSHVLPLTSYVSRTIDLDILFYASEVVDLPELTIPHPHIAERRFVLVPMVEISGELVHPGLGKSINQLFEECQDPSEVRLIG